MVMDSVSLRPGLQATAATGERENARSVPAWRSMAARIEDEIRTGRFPPGSVMPGEIELGRQFSTSRATAAHALDSLARQGLVKRIQGKGTFVAASQTHPDVSLVATHAVEFIAVGGGDHGVREFAGTAAGRVVARLAVAAGGFWHPVAPDLTVASLLGPPAAAGRARSVNVHAGTRAEFGGVTLRASVAVRDEFSGDTARAVSLLHPGFFSLVWNVSTPL